MFKTSDLLKLVLVIHFVELAVSIPLSDEDIYDNLIVSIEMKKSEIK